MVKPASTVGTCCYVGCKKSFLTDKETTFFKFPDDLERRKKWIANCGNPELGTLAERQLRGKRICINHFPARAFTSKKNVLKDTAVPTPTTAAVPPPVAKTSITPNKPNVVTPSTSTATVGSKPPTPTVVTATKISTPTTSASTVKPVNSGSANQTKTTTPVPTAAKSVTKVSQSKTSTPEASAPASKSTTPNTVASKKISGTELTTSRPANASTVVTQTKTTKPVSTTVKPAGKLSQTNSHTTSTPSPSATKPTATVTETKVSAASSTTAKPVITETPSKSSATATSTTKPAVKSAISKAKINTPPSAAKLPSTATVAKTKVTAPTLTTPKPVKTATMAQTRSNTPASSSIKAAAALVLSKTITPASKELATAPVPAIVPTTPKRGKGRPPKIIQEVAVKSEPIDTPEIPELPLMHIEPKVIEDSRKYISMPSLVLANEIENVSVAPSTSETPVVTERAKTAPTKKRKRTKLSSAEKDLKTKLRKIAVGVLQPNSEGLNVEMSSGSSDEEEGDDETSHSLGSSEEEKRTNGSSDNKEFTRFHKILKAKVVLPDSWSLGAILWDPSKKMKVIPASEVDVSANGTVRLKRCVQIYETMQTKVTIDGFDLTHRYDVKVVSGHNDVTRLILLVARSKICCGIKNVSSEDAMYFADAVPRGTTFYSEACPVIIGKQSTGPLCNNCHKLRNAIKRRKTEQKRAIEMRRAKRSSLHTVNSPFGKALYTLLSDLMADESDPKAKKKKRLSTLYSRGHNICIKDKEGEATEKGIPERATNSASISYIMQDIVSKMSLGKTSQEPQSQFFKTEDDDMEMQIINGSVDANSGNLVVQNAADFTLAEGQEYELIGEVDPNDVQVVEMIKERPKSPPQYQIIQVDDHTLAQMNYSGMFLQDSEGQIVNVTDMDMNDQSMGQLLKVISSNSTHGF